jgi:hypothetical protein
MGNILLILWGLMWVCSEIINRWDYRAELFDTQNILKYCQSITTAEHRPIS